MTPANIIGMAKLKELRAIAITDHNSCRNCGPAMDLGEEAGILVIPGMELTSEEEVHVICLFETLSDAMAFDAYVYQRLQKIANSPSIFGNQFVVDAEEEILSEEPYLMINATTISFNEVFSLVKEFHGIMIPAHIDKSSNSLLSNLGFIPMESQFTCVEVKELESIPNLRKQNPYLNQCRVITNSDAHNLWGLNEAIHSIYVKEVTTKEVLKALTILLN
jgi:PHP family Zn ribbon phosphoesterase